MAIQYGQYNVPTVEECVNFGVGQPAATMLPLELVRESAARKFAETDPLFLQYGFISGYPAFRESLARFLSEGYGQKVDPSLLFATNGISGALGLLCSLFVGRGDVVVVEEPSYFLALSIFRDFGLTIVPVSIDTDGMRVDELEAKLAAGVRPKFVYCIPAFQNPTCATMSAARKEKLVALAGKYDFLVFADEVYQLLGFNGVAAPPPPLCYFDTVGRVISMGSFAKILAPGLRLGWLQTSAAGAHLLKRLNDCGQLDSSGAVNPVISGIVHSFIDAGYQASHLAAVRSELTQRGQRLTAVLKRCLPPTATFTPPLGGYFIWIHLPDGITGTELLDFALSKGYKVKFHPGVRFGTDLHSYIRLSFSWYNAADLETGAERLAAAMNDLLAAKAAAAPAAGAATAASAPTVRVAVQGATGRLGSLIVAALSAADASSGCALAGTIGRDGVLPADADVVVDVSSAVGTASLVASLTARAASGARAPALVVGTTGDLPLDALRAYGKLAPVVLSANFSVGVPLVLSMLGACKNALPAGWHAEVSEIHHTAKKDAPSGTAKRLVAGLVAAGVQPHGEVEHTAIPTHALRLGDTIGQHTVYLAGPGERVEVTHIATKREVFAIGALRTAVWARAQAAGYYVK